MGLAIPLLAGLLEAFFLAETTLLWTGLGALISSVAGLVGGLWLRRLILAAGVRAPLRAAGIEYAMPVPTRS
jgi:formate-dependent nitrite reductase membrane component NrfD